MGRALTQQLQFVTNWNVFPLENVCSSKAKSFTEICWLWSSCCKMQAICQLTCPAARPPATQQAAPARPSCPITAAVRLPWTSRASIFLQLARTSSGAPGIGSGSSMAWDPVSTACQHPTMGACLSTRNSASPPLRMPDLKPHWQIIWDNLKTKQKPSLFGFTFLVQAYVCNCTAWKYVTATILKVWLWAEGWESQAVWFWWPNTLNRIQS